MKLTLEGQSRMVLKDHNYSGYAGGAVSLIIGVGVAVLFMSNLIAVGVGVLFALIGIALIATTKMVTITLDKAAGKGAIELKGIIGSGSRDMDLSKIKKLTLSKIMTSSGTGSRYSNQPTGAIQFGATQYGNRQYSIHYEYIVNFVMDTGESLPFKLANVSAGITDVIMSPDEKEMKFVKQIADFLGVPMECVAPPSLGQTLSAITQGISGGMQTPPAM